MDLTVAALAFTAIFLVELPDKTFVATLVLATRYRATDVWLGVGLAFVVQTLIAVLVGTAVSRLPDGVVRAASLVMFLLGAVVLLRQARKAEHEEGQVVDRGGPRSGWRAVGTSFLVLFAAEWGDLSQLLTVSLVARYDAPWSVFAGSLAALLVVSGLAAFAGRSLTKRVPVRVLLYAGSGVCFVLALVTAYELVTAG